MSETKKGMPAAVRRWLIRGVLVLLYIALAVAVFLSGRVHSLLVDNKAIEDAGLRAFNGVRVTIDDQPPQDLFPRDRVKFDVKGQSHRIKIEPMGGETVEKSFSIPVPEDSMVISLPKLVAGREDWMVPFVSEASVHIAVPESFGVGDEVPEAPPAP